ncbi:hypothetical protein H0H92_004465 [Tricholoma furcatifolium]|nr:hypothetical protein H0H92_004465 [Tricholoma furcatifolium]
MEPLVTTPTWSDEAERTPETLAYTDGSCIRNGSMDAIAGAGVWFGEDDEQNIAARLPMTLENSNNAGEAVAVLLAIRKARPEVTLRILTDSKITMDELTILLRKHEDRGWLDIANKNIVKTIVDCLRQRSGPAVFRKVKGHSNLEGNEGADRLAKEGAEKPAPDEMEIPNKWKLVHSGAKLNKATQKLLYATIISKAEAPRRLSTLRNLEAVREAVADNTGDDTPSDKRIWSSLKTPTITKETRAFLWKTLQGAYKLGTFWERIPDYEHRANCPSCGSTETMYHILLECEASGQEYVWRRVASLLNVRGIKWTPPHTGQHSGIHDDRTKLRARRDDACRPKNACDHDNGISASDLENTLRMENSERLRP